MPCSGAVMRAPVECDVRTASPGEVQARALRAIYPGDPVKQPPSQVITNFSRKPVHFAASAGGHLDLLVTIADRTVGRQNVTWVTSRSERGAEISRADLTVELLPEHHRGPIALLRNAL